MLNYAIKQLSYKHIKHEPQPTQKTINEKQSIKRTKQEIT